MTMNPSSSQSNLPRPRAIFSTGEGARAGAFPWTAASCCASLRSSANSFAQLRHFIPVH